MARDREMVQAVRAVNRKALGMSDACCANCEHGGSCEGSKAEVGPYGQSVRGVRGMAATVPGVSSFIPKVRVGSSFPAVDLTFDPMQPSAPPSGSSGGLVYEWIEKHVTRPFVEVGPVRYAPGDGYADYSGIAKAIFWSALGVGTVAGGVMVARAAWPSSWIAKASA